MRSDCPFPVFLAACLMTGLLGVGCDRVVTPTVPEKKSSGREVPADVPEKAEGPENPDGDNTTARIELARALRNGGNLIEAEGEFRKVYAEAPDRIEARLELAQVLAFQSKNEEAAALLEGVDEKQGGVLLWSVRADLAVAAKRFEEAAEILGRILVQNPDDNRIRLHRAEVLSWLKNYDASLEEYEFLLKKIPGDVQLRRQYARVLGWASYHERSAQEFRKTLP